MKNQGSISIPCICKQRIATYNNQVQTLESLTVNYNTQFIGLKIDRFNFTNTQVLTMAEWLRALVCRLSGRG